MEQKVTLKQKIQSENFMYKLSGISLIVYSLSKIFWLYYENLVQYLLDEKQKFMLEKLYVEVPILIFTMLILPTLFCIVSIIAGIFWLKKNYNINIIFTGIMCIYPLVNIIHSLSGVIYNFTTDIMIEKSYSMVLMSMSELILNIVFFLMLFCQVICIIRKKRSLSIKKLWNVTIVISVIHFALVFFKTFGNAMFLVFLYFLLLSISESNNIKEVMDGMIVILEYIVPYALKILPDILLTIHYFFCGIVLRK